MIKMFYLSGCPYCRQAFKAIEELKAEDPKFGPVAIEMIEESEDPVTADAYDYYYVPTMFIGDEKLYEAHRGETYEECKENVRRVFEAELKA
ncbi:MAG: thioredoxin family protein [Oscillospiraceae bacterium]|nr:thioredoxin family protein [Oscillospiraceae bacterium]